LTIRCFHKIANESTQKCITREKSSKNVFITLIPRRKEFLARIHDDSNGVSNSKPVSENKTPFQASKMWLGNCAQGSIQRKRLGCNSRIHVCNIFNDTNVISEIEPRGQFYENDWAVPNSRIHVCNILIDTDVIRKLSSEINSTKKIGL
jgi:hypothetical protein